MVKAAVARHMPSVEGYRERLATLQGAWDTLSLLSHLRGDGADMSGTRHAFEQLASELVTSLAEETCRKTLLALTAKSQIAIDVLVRNLYERTADIGFLATDAEIKQFLQSTRTGEVTESSRELLRKRFREYVAKYSVYHDVILLGASGEVLARLDDANTATRTDHPLLARTLSTRQGYVETFGAIDLLPQSASNLVYSFRVGDAARPDGVLCLCFRFADEVAGIFAKLLEADDWTVFCFLDATGCVIASSDPWQVPIGAPLPLACEEGGRVVRFAGREYLAITRRTQGYQGYLGPGWHGHAMVPIEHAFERQNETGAPAIAAELLAQLRESETIFSPALRRIPQQAEVIQRELNRTVWNGNVRLSQSASDAGDFSKVLLREIGNAGRRTQETFERSISELQQTVVSSILQDTHLLASLAVDVLDRNLYERANDCRWWALDGTLRSALQQPDGLHAERAAEVLRHINGLYTVYTGIVLFDGAARVVAVSNPAHDGAIGTTIAEPWAAATLALRDSQQYAVSAFAPCMFYGDQPTLVYGAALRDPHGRVLGGVGIVFDAAPQFAAMLRDALPRTDAGAPAPGCIGALVDAQMRVMAATSEFAVGDVLPLPLEMLREACGTARIVELNQQHYALGMRKTAGYREYPGLGTFAVMLIPLGRAVTLARRPRRVQQDAAQRHNAAGTATVDVATFHCGEHRLGLLRDEIVEALDGSQLRPVPNSPPWHAGLLLYRDGTLPIIDLCRLLDPQQPRTARNVIVVRAAQSGMSVGLLVDELADIPEIAADRILPVGDLGQNNRVAVLDRAVRPERPDDPVLMLINVQQLLSLTRVGGSAGQAGSGAVHRSRAVHAAAS